jgi:hypothetical protein
MHVVEAKKWNRELILVESVDSQVGDELQKESHPVLLNLTQDLLVKAESEVRLRDLELIKRDYELVKNINIIDGLYDSYRYRVGRFLVKPIEVIAIRLGLIAESTSRSDNLKIEDLKDSVT